MIILSLLIRLFRQSPVLLLFLLFGIECIQAQDPVYCKLVSRTTTTSSRPWSSSSSSSSQRQRRQQYYQQTVDYSDKFISLDQVRHDKNARLYRVDFKSRRPNQFSITSRLVLWTILSFGVQVWRPAVTAAGMKLSDRILRGEQLYRLVTPIFLHGGIFHLFTNMVSLQRVGNDVERLFGPGRYLATYMVAGVAGNVLSALQSPNPSLGASGAVFGVVGAYYVFLSRNEWLLGSYGQALTASITQTMGTNILLGLVNPQIDQWAHVGGALAGGAMAYFFGPRLYLAELPIGRVMIDRPILRAPESLEQVPQQIGQAWQRISEGVEKQVNRILPGTSGNPWRPPKTNMRQRRQVPNRSIKPGIVD